MDNERLAELFDGLGPVTITRLFGGKGIYHGGVIVAIVLHGELMLKGDDLIGHEYEAAGSSRWTYVGKRHGKIVAMPYWTVPDAPWTIPTKWPAGRERPTRRD